jgi:hypothetical protein
MIRNELGAIVFHGGRWQLVAAPPLVTRSVQILGVPLLLAGVVAAGTAHLTASHAAAGRARVARPATSRAVPKTGTLFGVAATSARHAWSVGQSLSGKSIILRWNGSAWSQVPSPTPRGGGAYYAVAATSASNAWAVGGNDSKPFKTLIAHWDGTSWKQVPSPTPSAGGALFGVAATSARNAWAVGCAGNCYQGFGHAPQTLILHWNGTSWKRVTSPSPGPGTSLSAVAAASASSAWAVGCTRDCFISSASPQTVILHWNGQAWKQVASPAGATTGALNGVAATSPGNAWVVGCTGHCFGPDAAPGTLIAHWNGSTWKKVAAPSPAGGSLLTGVATRSAGRAWAVGYTRASGKTLILRWNGASWSRVASPTPAHGGELLGTAIGSPGSAWAVGASDFGNLLLEHWNGSVWK